MRSLVRDFDLTILWPLIAISAIAIVQFARAYITKRSAFRHIERNFEREVRAGAVGVDTLDLRDEVRRSKSRIGYILLASSVVLCALVCVLLMGDIWKLHVAYRMWNLLWIVSSISVVVALVMAWLCAKESNWSGLGICLLAILMAVASAEHFFHQTVNSGRITCPRCSDDDTDNSDN